MPYLSKPGTDLVVMLINDRQTDRRAVQQAQSLREQGFRVEFVSWKHGEDDPVEVDGFRIRRVDYNGFQEHFYQLMHQSLVLNTKVAGSALSQAFDEIGDDLILRTAERLGGRQQVAEGARAVKQVGVKALNFAAWALTKAMIIPYKATRIPPMRVVVRRLAIASVFSKLHNTYAHEKVYAVQSHDLDSAWMGMHLAESLKVPLVFDAHEIYLEQVGLNKWFKRYYATVEPQILQRANFWMIVNDLAGEWMVDHYRKRGIEIAAPLVVQNSVPYWHDEGRYDLLRETLGIPRDIKIALYQGGVAPRRNIETIVDAAKLLEPGWVVVILGDGRYVEDLKVRAGDAIGKKIYFKPAVPQAELLKYTSSADVGLIPYTGVDTNTRFASPNKLYEFLQVGMPIVANGLPFLTKKLTATKNGVNIDFERAEVVAETINRLTSEQLTAWREAARKVKAIECWEHEAKAYVQRMLALGNREARTDVSASTGVLVS